MNKLLEPNFNSLPPVNDWDMVYLALQQANEKFFRSATAKDFGKQIIGDVAIQGADFEDLPIATSAAPVALPVPEAEMKFGFLANGTYTQPNGPNLVYTDVQWGLTLFDGTRWIKKFTLTIPKGQDGKDGVDGASLLEIWSTTSPNYPYKVNVQVRDSVGKTFVSLVANNTFALTDVTKWESVGIDITSTIDINDSIKAVSGKAVGDYAPRYKTYNLFNIKEVQYGKYVSAAGIILSSSLYNITGYIPILPNTEYRNNVKPTGNATISFFDENKLWLGNITQASNVNTFVSLYNAYFVIYNIHINGIYDDAMLVEGKYVRQYLPYDLSFDYRSFSTSKYAKSKKMFRANENIGFRTCKSNGDFDFYPPRLPGATGYDIVPETSETAKRYGSENAMRFRGSNATVIVGGTLYFESWDKIPTYLYASVILKTNDPAIGLPLFNGIRYGSTSVSAYIKREMIELEPGVYLVNVVCEKIASTNGAVRIWINFDVKDANAYNYELSGLSYYFDNEYLPDLSLLYKLEGEDRWGQKVDSDVYFSGYNYIESKIRRKKVALYGTSIDTRPYFKRVADKYDLTYINLALGGGGILYSEDDSKLIELYGGVASAKDAMGATWSASVPEKEAFFALKGWTLTDANREVSYDQSILTNLNTDVFCIGTYGVNDRKPGALVIDKVNRKYDRSTVYGAYNYVLRKLFEAKPTARVIIFGQFNNNATDEINDIQREVCKDWCIPFLDWGAKMGMANEKITIDGAETTLLRAVFAADGLHPTSYAQEVMGEFLIRALRDYL